MKTLEMQHPVSGKPITIENPLLTEHVQVGRLLWYWGFTSISSWNCPAVITQIDDKKRQFRVRSLDDMKEQDQWYSYSAGKNAPTSRMTMRVATSEEVQSYLNAQRERLKDSVIDAKQAFSRALKASRDFDRERDALKL